jgi:lysophospholipase L1-like esterase
MGKKYVVRPGAGDPSQFSSEIHLVAPDGTPFEVARQPAQTIALLGTSITNQNGNRQLSGADNQWIYQNMGYFTHAHNILRHRFQIVRPANGTEDEFGGSGKTAQRMIDEGDVAAVIAAAPSWCVVEAGTNDIFGTSPAAVSGAVSFNAVKTIVESLTAAGIRTIVTTVKARQGTNSETADMFVQQRIHNELLRRWVPTRRNAVLCDWAHTLLDPATGKANALYLYDGIHPNGAGASRLGAVLAATIDAISAPSDELAFTTTGILGGQGFTVGTTGNYSGGNPGGGSGPLATGTTCYVDTGTTLVASQIARTDLAPGSWQQIAVSAVGGNLTGYGLMYRADLAPNGLAVGDTVYGVIEFETDAAAWAVKSMHLTLGQNNNNQLSAWGTNSSITAHEATALYRPVSGSIRTPPLVVKSGATDLRLYARAFGGTGTIRWGRAQIYKL